MKLLFLVDRIMPIGASAIAVGQMKAAAEAGHEVSLVTTYESRIDYELRRRLRDVFFLLGLGNRPVENPVEAAQRGAREVVSAIDGRRFDLAISHNFGRFGGPPALRALNLRMPLILWCHDEYPWAGYHFEFHNYAGALTRTYEPWDGGRLGLAYHSEQLAAFPQAIFASPSKWLHRRVEAATSGAPGILPLHLTNGIDKDAFASFESYAPFEKKQAGLRVICVGTLTDPRKNIVYALRELGRLPAHILAAIEVVIVGGNPDGFAKAELRDLAALPKSSGFLRSQALPGHLLRQCKVAGWVHSPAAMATLYRSAAVVLHPSQAENYPTVCLEARLSGVPVLASDAGGTSETLGTEDKAIALPLRPFDFTTPIKRILLAHGDQPLDRGSATPNPIVSDKESWCHVESLLSTLS